MASRFEWTGIGPFLLGWAVAVALTAWQSRIDRSVFERFFGPVGPVPVMTGAALLGLVAVARLQKVSDFAVIGPGPSRNALWITAGGVMLFGLAAIAADLAFGYPEDMNVTMPDAIRFYPAIAVFVETVLHVLPIALLVGLLGAPTGPDSSLWRIAIPVALIEACLQAAYATSVSTTIFSALHLTMFGLAQVWMFWRFGFVWMLGFRLAYYAVWHMGWGVARLGLLY